METNNRPWLDRLKHHLAASGGEEAPENASLTYPQNLQYPATDSFVGFVGAPPTNEPAHTEDIEGKRRPSEPVRAVPQAHEEPQPSHPLLPPFLTRQRELVLRVITSLQAENGSRLVSFAQIERAVGTRLTQKQIAAALTALVIAEYVVREGRWDPEPRYGTRTVSAQATLPPTVSVQKGGAA